MERSIYDMPNRWTTNMSHIITLRAKSNVATRQYVELAMTNEENACHKNCGNHVHLKRE